MMLRLHSKAVLLQPHSETAPKDSGAGDSSQWKELQSVLLIVCFAYKEEWPEVQVFYSP